jgi:ferredoxin
MGKFIIHAEEALAKKPVVKKFILERGNGCVNCSKCAYVCIYDVHKRSAQDCRKMADPDIAGCKHCFSCIQFCPAGALKITPNPEYDRLGDELFSPDMVTTIMREAENGQTPVSGGGYGGRFSGSGFDSFWTDMSEIVRPTRDGIHAREYISTAVEIGRKPENVNFLKFDSLGNPLTNIFPGIEINLPVLFDLRSFSLKHPYLSMACAMCAAPLGTVAIVEKAGIHDEILEYSNHLVESLDPAMLSWRELMR